MKRTSLVLTLLAVLALVAAACGGDSGGGGGGGEGAQGRDAEVDASLCPTAALEAATEPVEIEFWHAMTASNEETLDEMVADYNASQDAVEVTARVRRYDSVAAGESSMKPFATNVLVPRS